LQEIPLFSGLRGAIAVFTPQGKVRGTGAD